MKRIITLIIFAFTLIQGYSQTKGISYQAVILSPNEQQIPGENATNNILVNSQIVIQFTIVDELNNIEYQEYHTTTTDKYGMINLLIGSGNPESTNDFSDIIWNGTSKKLKVAIDFSGNGGNYSPLSEQILSYMPQPLNEVDSQLILDNAAAIATKEADISTLQTEQATQNAAIALNTAKTGITPTQASTIAATSGTNTGDQDISGIVTNATDIAANSAAVLLKEDKVNKSTNVVTDGASDVMYPSVKAVKTYVDANILAGSPATSANTIAIASNTTDIATNTTDISTNITNIAGNTTDIAGNTTDITTNATNIAENTTDIASNVTNISTNATDIAGNITDIASNAAAILLKEDKVNKSTNVVTDGASDIKYPSVKAIKTYVDASIITGSPATAANTIAISTNATDISTNITNIAGNTTDIATNATNIAGNTTDIASNVTNISTNTTDIAGNTTDIATNATDIAGNTTDIASNVTNISTNTTDIAGNTTDIATNATDIAGNTTNITTNATDITGNTTDIASNVTNISTNTTDIAGNTTDIATNATDIAGNTTNITTNATNIAGNTTDIASNVTNISTNATDIAANSTDIATLQTEQTTQNTAIALNTAKVTNATHTGDVTGATVLTIGDGKVTDAKIVAVAASKLTGTVAIVNGGTGATTKVAGFDALSPMTAAGDIIYGGTSGTGTTLVKGTANQVLTMNAGATAPEWKTPAAGVTNINGLSDGRTTPSSVFLGFRSGQSDNLGATNNNTGVGIDALRVNSTGWKNTAVGFAALNVNTNGDYNTAVGSSALKAYSGSGGYNTSIGAHTLLVNTTGTHNVALGALALYKTTTASSNVALGANTLYNNVTGAGNIAIGNSAGYNETGSNKLYIENSSSTTPLIYGDFSSNYLTFNGTLNLKDGTSAGNLSIYEASGNGTNKVTMQTPALAADYTLTLPVDDGTLNQTLTTNGAGVLSWTTPATGVTDINGLSDGKSDGQSTFLGTGAGANDNGGSSPNTAIGNNALNTNVSGIRNVAVGYLALNKNTSNDNTAVGNQALENNTTGLDNIAIGTLALQTNTTASQSTAVGFGALQNSNGQWNVALGNSTLSSVTSGTNNVAIGTSAGKSLVTGSGNLFLGHNAGFNETGSNKLYISNTTTATPLIYGDFATNLLRANGNLEVTGTVKIEGGIPGVGKVLTSDANGLASWTTNPVASIDGLSDGIYDGTSIFLGGGGTSDDGGNVNTGVGKNALSSVTSGISNTAIGYSASAGTTTGSSNVAIGHFANLLNNVGSQNVVIGDEAGKNLGGGSGNILIGYQAGIGQVLNNKLYIENSSSATPLIYGEFDTNLVRANGNLEVSGTVKIEGGTPGVGKVLTSDANGLASWTTPASPTSSLVTKTANYTITTSDKYVVCTTGGITITLPTAVGASGTEYTIKNMSATNVTITTTSSQQIWQDATNKTTTATLGVTTQNNWIKVVSDGTNWISFRALY